MQKVLFRQLQTTELQDEGKPNVALVFILLTYPTRTKFHTQRHGCLWFITIIPGLSPSQVAGS